MRTEKIKFLNLNEKEKNTIIEKGLDFYKKYISSFFLEFYDDLQNIYPFSIKTSYNEEKIYENNDRKIIFIIQIERFTLSTSFLITYSEKRKCYKIIIERYFIDDKNDIQSKFKMIQSLYLPRVYFYNTKRELQYDENNKYVEKIKNLHMYSNESCYNIIEIMARLRDARLKAKRHLEMDLSNANLTLSKKIKLRNKYKTWNLLNGNYFALDRDLTDLLYYISLINLRFFVKRIPDLKFKCDKIYMYLNEYNKLKFEINFNNTQIDKKRLEIERDVYNKILPSSQPIISEGDYPYVMEKDDPKRLSY